MKKYNYKNISENEHIYHTWEPLKFNIKDNYKYIITNPFFKIISNIIAIPIGIILIIINKIIYGYKIENKENLIKNSGFVSVSNHLHPMDCTMIGLIYYPKRVYYPTIKRNFQIPLVRHLIRLLYAMPIPTKENQKRDFYKQINNALLKRKIVHMYPEGSMWPYYEEVRNFKYGAFKMAVDANVSIQPIRFLLTNPQGIYKLYKKNKCFHAIILKPIYPNETLPYEERIADLKERTFASIKGVIK